VSAAKGPGRGVAFVACMDRLAGKAASLRGWRRAAVGAAMGALASLAFAPYDAWPVMFASFGVLVWLLDGCHGGENTRGARVKSAAWVGFCFGFGFFLAGFYWIADAFLVEPWRDGWLIPFVLAGFPAWMGLYFAGGAALAMLLWAKGAARVLALAIGFGIAEFVRGHAFTGQPWDLIGYALTDTLPMMQLASLFGVYALSVLAVALFAAPLAIFAPGPNGAEGRLGASLLAALLLILLGAGTLWGAARLSHGKTVLTPLRLRIVQPSVSEADKWKPGNQDAIFGDYLDMSRETKGGVGLKGIDLVIWPETAVPIPLGNDPEALRIIGNMLPKGTTLVAGSIRLSQTADRLGRLSPIKFYNSLLVIGDQGRLLDSYDKIHLVPFGEYLPFETLMDRWGIMALTGMRGGFTAGSGPRRLAVPGAPPAMPLICYEILFPDEVNSDKTRTGWMLNVTNDAWFGRSIGPYQHFHQARVRAVEQGLPLVRSANTGISGVVDAYGRVTAKLGLEKRGIVDAALPAAIPPTLFVHYERPIEIGVLLLALIGWLAVRVQSINR
jgi:apolipoprotein N-acyltransferase